MKFNLTFLVALLLILVDVHCVDPDPEVKKSIRGAVVSGTPEPKITLNEKPDKPDSNLESKKTEPLVKAKDQVVDSNDVQNANVDKIKSEPRKPLGDIETVNGQTDSIDSKLVKDDEKKSKADKGSGSKEATKEENLSSMRKESFRGEQCDSSFKCTVGTDENHEMVACLRVPGDESPELSLLIQNKGKDPLDVDISAPDFVRLDKSRIQIQEKNNQKVMVSIGDGKIDKFITLKTANGNCSLDFRDFLTHNPIKKSNHIPPLTYTSLFRQTPFLGLVSLASILVIASVLMCVAYQRRRLGISGSKYQKLDSELPVSGGPKPGFDQKGGPKAGFDQKDGWDDNWSDDWDDVEAPSTPSMPVTPSISSSGVSSRRVNKDGWKD